MIQIGNPILAPKRLIPDDEKRHTKHVAAHGFFEVGGIFLRPFQETRIDQAAVKTRSL